MLRWARIGGLAALATLAATAGQAQTTTYGLFRENSATLPYNHRHCWVQGMISGQTINAELLARRHTQQKADCELHRYIRHALCARDRMLPHPDCSRNSSSQPSGS